MHFSWLYYVVFGIVGIFAGFVDSIAGGGGLITIPALLSAGLPPHIALGTNKFQASFGSFTSSYRYVKHSDVNLRDATPGIIYTLIGSAIGGYAVQQVHAEVLNLIIPILLLVILIYSIFSPNLGSLDSPHKMKAKWFYLIFGLCIGFYDGFFGPGTGSFWAVAFVLCLGFNFVKATGYTKVMNFTSNIFSLILFLILGNVNFAVGLAMGVGEVIGARLGTSLVLSKGVRFIRPIFITVVLATTIKLLYNYLK